MFEQSVVIVSAKRTPMGAFQGQFAHLKTAELGSAAIRAVIQEAALAPDMVDEVVMGCVLSGGVGQAPARQAALGASLAQKTSCTTVNKVCGSGMKAVMQACDQIKLGAHHVMIAGGMESMSNAPYLLDRARSGYRLGHGKVLDHMFFDGLEDPYTNRLMGTFAEDTAEFYGFTRADQDAFACASLQRAHHAQEKGDFHPEITPIQIVTKKWTEEITVDEPPCKANMDKIPTLKPAFRDGGTVTAANSSSIADGAAALLLMSEETAQAQGAKVLGKIRGYTSFAQAPEWFTTAPVGAIKKLCDQLNWSIEDVDLFEINEAFAIVTMAAMKDLHIPHEKVNVLGGACALGHPIGASGARVIVTLVHALANRGLKRGIACLCIGGGEATAVGIECA